MSEILSRERFLNDLAKVALAKPYPSGNMSPEEDRLLKNDAALRREIKTLRGLLIGAHGWLLLHDEAVDMEKAVRAKLAEPAP